MKEAPQLYVVSTHLFVLHLMQYMWKLGICPVMQVAYCLQYCILLTMRVDSTLFYLHVLSPFLQPWARLIRCFQTSDIDIVNELQSAKAVIAVIQDTDMQDVFESSQKVLSRI